MKLVKSTRDSPRYIYTLVLRWIVWFSNQVIAGRPSCFLFSLYKRYLTYGLRRRLFMYVCYYVVTSYFHWVLMVMNLTCFTNTYYICCFIIIWWCYENKMFFIKKDAVMFFSRHSTTPWSKFISVNLYLPESADNSVFPCIVVLL